MIPVSPPSHEDLHTFIHNTRIEDFTRAFDQIANTSKQLEKLPLDILPGFLERLKTIGCARSFPHILYRAHMYP